MKLTVDCVVTADMAHLPKESALSHLLAKGGVTYVSQALEFLLCEQFGLKRNGDFPIAAMSASVDGVSIENAYYLRADPVHFVMQRDSFSLSAPAPVLLSFEHAKQVLMSLNEHFVEEGLTFYVGQSGAWYVAIKEAQELQTSLPSEAINKNVHHFMPQGRDKARWRAVLNEAQMLLHQHPCNIEREENGQLAVNSLWFSGGGVLSAFNLNAGDLSLVVAHSPLYQGLAHYAGITYQANADLAQLLQDAPPHARVQLAVRHRDDDNSFELLLGALKSGRVSQLTLNVGLYEKCLVLKINPIDLYKFWRKPYALAHYLV